MAIAGPGPTNDHRFSGCVRITATTTGASAAFLVDDGRIAGITREPSITDIVVSTAADGSPIVTIGGGTASSLAPFDEFDLWHPPPVPRGGDLVFAWDLTATPLGDLTLWQQFRAGHLVWHRHEPPPHASAPQARVETTWAQRLDWRAGRSPLLDVISGRAQGAWQALQLAQAFHGLSGLQGQPAEVSPAVMWLAQACSDPVMRETLVDPWRRDSRNDRTG